MSCLIFTPPTPPPTPPTPIPKYRVDYLTLREQLHKLHQKRVFVFVPSVTLNLDACIQTECELTRFNNPNARIEFKANSDDATRLFKRSNPLAFRDNYISSRVVVGGNAERFLFVKNPLDFKPEILASILNEKYDAIYFYGAYDMPTDDANFIAHTLEKDSVHLLRAPCFEVK